MGAESAISAEILNHASAPHDPAWPAVLEYLTGHYGESPVNWGDSVYCRLRPHWTVVYAAAPDELVARALR